MMIRFFSGTILVALLVGAFVTGTSQPAIALSGSEFDPGNIISNDNFYNAGAMNEAEVQSFLNSRVPRCAATAHPCLRDYRETTRSRDAAGSAHCAAYNGDVAESAARIIVKVAGACGINPQVLIATLQKERGLVTKTAPTAADYRVAMGYGCPDTAPCDTQYYGFYNQVYRAAWQFRQYTKTPNSWRYRVGPTTVQWHPNASCGSTVVDITNQATANLYNYTPYQPNAAALANLGGSGDSCSSYGNRNFWVYFNSWFGPSTIPALPVGNVDVAWGIEGGVRVAGWAFDPESPLPLDVHVYLDGNWAAALRADRGRPDVATKFPSYGPFHGFDSVIGAPVGSHRVCVYAINMGAGTRNPQLGCASVMVPSAPPRGSVDEVKLVGSGILIRGWALDPDTAAPLQVHFYRNGRYAGQIAADGQREDVGVAFPAYGSARGFSVDLASVAGENEVCAFAIDVGGTRNSALGCRTVIRPVEKPLGNLESVVRTTGGAIATGWAFDPDGQGTSLVHFYLDGRWAGQVVPSVQRLDVPRVHASAGPMTGYSISVSAAPDSRRLCAFAIDSEDETVNTPLGCRTL